MRSSEFPHNSKPGTNITPLRNHSRVQDRRLEQLTRELEVARRKAAEARRSPVANADHGIIGAPVSTPECPPTSVHRSESASEPGAEQDTRPAQ